MYTSSYNENMDKKAKFTGSEKDLHSGCTAQQGGLGLAGFSTRNRR